MAKLLAPVDILIAMIVNLVRVIWSFLCCLWSLLTCVLTFGLYTPPSEHGDESNLDVIIAVFLLFVAQIMAAIVVEDGKGIRHTNLLIYCASSILLLLILRVLTHYTRDRLTYRFGSWFVGAGVVVLAIFVIAGEKGLLPGQVPLRLISYDVDYVEKVDPGGLPGLKIQVSLSGCRYEPFGSGALILDTILDDESRKQWMLSEIPSLTKKLADGTWTTVDISKNVNLTTDHEYVSPITFKTYEDGHDYQLTVFFREYSDAFVKDVQRLNAIKDSTSQNDIAAREAVVAVYTKIAKESQAKIAARHGIRIELHK